MPLERLFYAVVIACFMIVHYVALQRIDAMASDTIRRPSHIMPPTD